MGRIMTEIREELVKVVDRQKYMPDPENDFAILLSYSTYYDLIEELLEEGVCMYHKPQHFEGHRIYLRPTMEEIVIIIEKPKA